jgi:hypothetical protein
LKDDDLGTDYDLTAERRAWRRLFQLRSEAGRLDGGESQELAKTLHGRRARGSSETPRRDDIGQL